MTPAPREFPQAFGGLALLKPLRRDERAEVFVAFRPDGIDRLAVVNIIAPALLDREGIAPALRAQAGWLVARVHGNLVQTYDVGQVGDRVFLVNEYVEGRDLTAVLDAMSGRPKGIPVESAIHIGLDVAAAVQFIRATEEKITGIPTSFSGLSSSAVIVSRQGAIKFLQHGSSLATLPAEFRPEEAGRASLVAPEHVDGGGSAQGDVYLVGALLWQALVGRPLAGPHARVHLDLLRNGGFRPESPITQARARAGISPSLDKLILAALAPRPEDRPATCEALRAELVSISKELSVEGDLAGDQLLAGIVNDVFGAVLAVEQADLARLSAAAERLFDTPGPKTTSQTLASFEAGGKKRAPSEESQLPIGEVIPGTRYRALAKLGEGGMGAVYAAEHVDIERKVALKLVHADFLLNPIVLGQFRQEARAASKIGNPYICDVTDWGELSDGRVFFVMEFIDGMSVGRALKEKSLPSSRTIPILRQVTKALGAAHEKGIVHLDIKPDNILLFEKDGRQDAVKVVDFGVAGVLGQAAGSTKIMGTPEYMAPERALGKGYDHRSDIYSLGIMAYEMLVGDVPFHGATPIETLALQASSHAEPMGHRRGAPPTALEQVVFQMLAKDPDRRPQSMAEVEARLCEAQIEAKIRTPWDDLALPVLSPERSARISRRLRPAARRPRQLALAAAGIAVIGVSAAIALAIRGPEVVVIKEAPLASGSLSSPPPAAPSTTTTMRPVTGAAVEPASEGVSTAGTPKRRREDAQPVVSDAERGNQAAERGNLAKEASARGFTALSLGRLAQAEKDFAAALESDPTSAQALGGMAEVAFEQARYAEALSMAHRAARLAPRIAKHHNLLGDACYKLLRFDDALKAYEKALALTPDDASLRASVDRVKAKVAAATPPP